jgi:hypothetical protein
VLTLSTLLVSLILSSDSEDQCFYDAAIEIPGRMQVVTSTVRPLVGMADISKAFHVTVRNMEAGEVIAAIKEVMRLLKDLAVDWQGVVQDWVKVSSLPPSYLQSCTHVFVSLVLSRSSYYVHYYTQ